MEHKLFSLGNLLQELCAGCVTKIFICSSKIDTNSVLNTALSTALTHANEEKSIPKIFCHWLLTPAIYNRANNKAGQRSSTRSEIESHWPRTRYFRFWLSMNRHTCPRDTLSRSNPLNGMTRTFIARHFSSPSLLRKKQLSWGIF